MTVLIAGAGWRVRRFVIPALRHHGIREDEIIVLRRSAIRDGLPDGIVVHTSLGELRHCEPHLTINCTPADVMLGVQWSILKRFPSATHFCDTPVLAKSDSPDRLPPPGIALYSLEDWPATPNLELIRNLVRGRRSWEVRIEHFGIATHFFAFIRGLAADAGPGIPVIERIGDEVVCQVAPERRATLAFPKELSVAKVFMRCDNEVIEDFFEVVSHGDDDDEVLQRVVSSGEIHYRVAGLEAGRWAVDPGILASFEPLSSRKNVHELDKFIALTRIFSFALTGKGSAPYRYIWSAEDARLARHMCP